MRYLTNLIARYRARRWVRTLPTSTKAQDARVVDWINAHLAGAL